MEDSEIDYRQSSRREGPSNPKTEKLAKRMVEIAKMNGMVSNAPEIPPVPRLVMGAHGN